MKAFSKVEPISRFALCACIVGVLALSICARPGSAQAQSKGHVDPALAKQGGKMFKDKGCAVCHTIGRTGKTAEGPDLAGVTDRRSHEWLVSWLKDPHAMFGNDAAADAMLEQYHNVKMPNMHLGASDISALIAYLSQFHQK